MALPSARRPAAALKILEEEELKKLKITLKKEDLVMNSVGDWAKARESKRYRKPLTRKMLHRRIILEAFRLNFSYNKLPKDWLKVLVKRYGLTLYKKKKRVHQKYLAEENAGNNCKTGKGMGENNSSCDDNSDLEKPNANTGEVPTKPESKKNPLDPIVKVPKKMIDLTDEPPPGWWLQYFAKGVVLPRKLQVYSDTDQTVIFYDYEDDQQDVRKSDEVDPTKGYVRIKHDRILKFDWWKDQAKEKTP